MPFPIEATKLLRQKPKLREVLAKMVEWKGGFSKI